MYIYKHPADTQFPFRSSSFAFPSHCAGSAHCLARGLIRARLIKLVRLVLDPWRYHVAKGAFSAGPDLGSPFTPPLLLSLPPLLLHLSAIFTYLIRSLPCAIHGHVGTCPIWTWKLLASAQGSLASNLLAPSLQLESLSTYSNHARAPSDARSRWIVAVPASNIG